MDVVVNYAVSWATPVLHYATMRGYTSQMTHRQICFVPRKWLGFPLNNLETILSREILSYLRMFKVSTSSVISIEGVEARLWYYDEHPWMRKEQDERKKPDFKEYSAFFIPCPYCT